MTREDNVSERSSAWRLIHDGACNSALNMAVDEALLQALLIGKSAPTLRLYQWASFAASLGRFQSIGRTIRRERPAEQEVPLVRRITGGRGILHGDDLTIAVVCRCADIGVSSQLNLAGIYSVFTEVFARAFAIVGIPTIQGQPLGLEPGHTKGDCFATITQADLVHRVSGVKMMGGALHRRDDAILFQASAPLHTAELGAAAQSLSAALFRGPNARALTEPVGPISADRFSMAIAQAVSLHLGLDLTTGKMSSSEYENAEHFALERYRDRLWTETGRSSVKLVHN